VVDVIDGETIDVEIQGEVYRVRYIGVDAPERGQWFYEASTLGNADLVANRTVELEADTSDMDRYGRLLRYVYVGEVMVNSELIRHGFARVNRLSPNTTYAYEFLHYEEEAREAQFGLWAGDDAER
jgi:micrococcal nuclease